MSTEYQSKDSDSASTVEVSEPEGLKDEAPVVERRARRIFVNPDGTIGWVPLGDELVPQEEEIWDPK